MVHHCTTLLRLSALRASQSVRASQLQPAPLLPTRWDEVRRQAKRPGKSRKYKEKKKRRGTEERTQVFKLNDNYSSLPIHTHCSNQMLCARETHPTLEKTLHSVVSTSLPHGLTFPAPTAREAAVAAAGTRTAGSPRVLWSHPTASCSFLASQKHRRSRSFSCAADQTQL